TSRDLPESLRKSFILPNVLLPGFSLAMDALEGDELLDLALGFVGEGVEFLDQLDVAGGDGLLGDAFEELADAHLELGEDAEEGVQADPVLPLLHAGEVGLLDAEAGGELHLGQLPLLA